ncbi:MoaD/ThiS family protein [Psychromonas sp. MME2]|uniref:MoaD/ThiS family protein n=1 Tax=unclassified Psychromonas TaxID=2614957 RepID=UPI00339C3498
MIRVFFFAQVREQVGVNELLLNSAENRDVTELLANLQGRGDNWQKSLGQANLLVAVNQVMSHRSQQLHSGDEVAFFPPVTGG